MSVSMGSTVILMTRGIRVGTIPWEITRLSEALFKMRGGPILEIVTRTVLVGNAGGRSCRGTGEVGLSPIYSRNVQGNINIKD